MAPHSHRCILVSRCWLKHNMRCCVRSSLYWPAHFGIKYTPHFPDVLCAAEKCYSLWLDTWITAIPSHYMYSAYYRKRLNITEVFKSLQILAKPRERSLMTLCRYLNQRVLMGCRTKKNPFTAKIITCLSLWHDKTRNAHLFICEKKVLSMSECHFFNEVSSIQNFRIWPTHIQHTLGSHS